MYRMGLIDFWYYTNEEFYFKNGHILLRGSNGSGKSVTMQSFIPILLDGNKNSERLDAFGTKARKMETYLIDENSNRDERIAYLYLEFKREDSNIFKTIGMGMRARKNKPMETWYFVIEDNQRIGRDIQLMEHNLAISKQSLKNKIQNQFIETQREYMARVNQALFQFPTLDDYKESINLLVKLRSPKLSNSLKPTIINELLSESLQPLSEEDLRPLTEALSNMDEVQNRLEVLKQSQQAAKSIQNVYEQYNYALLDKKSLQYIEQKNKLDELTKKQKELYDRKNQAQEMIHEIKKQVDNITVEKTVIEEEYSGLAKQDLLQLASDVQRYKEDLTQQEKALENKSQQESNKDNAYVSCKLKYDKQKDYNDSLEYEIHKSFKQLNELNENMQFDEHISLKQEFLKNLNHDYDFNYTKSKIDKELSVLNQGLELFQKMNNQKVLLNHVQDDYAKEQSLLEQIETELKAYQEQFRLLKEEYHEKFLSWNESNQILKMDASTMKIFFEIISDYGNSERYYEIDQDIHNRYVWYLKNQTETVSRLSIEIKQFMNELKKIQEQYEYWNDLKDPQPDIVKEQEEARHYLEGKNIPFIPMYTLLDFDDSLSQDEKNNIEEQLLSSGLMTALIIPDIYQKEVLNLPKGMKESFLFTHNKIENLIVYILHSKIEYNSLCKAFGLNEGSVKFFDNGLEIGNICSVISQTRQSIFIGKASREAYRKSQLDKLQEEIHIKKQDIQELENNLKIAQDKVKVLEKEYAGYPEKADLDSSLSDVNRMLLKQEHSIEQIKKYIEQRNQYQIGIQNLNKEITNISEKLGISNTEDVFRLRKDLFIEYKDELVQMESIHEKYIVNIDLFISLESQLEDLRMDLDSIRYEKKQLEIQLQKLQQLISIKEAQLNEMGYEKIKERMEQIMNRLDEIPKIISNLYQEDGRWQNTQEQCQKNILENASLIEMQNTKTENYKKYYESELDLGYVSMEEKNPVYVHKHVVNSYPNLKNKDTLGNDLQTVFFMNRGFLQDYNLHFITLFDDQEDTMARLDIKARYKGKQIDFTMLLKQLEIDIEKQSELVSTQDRHLIEDVLVNTISSKIRVHIRSSKRWIETMNKYMKEMNTSSTLKLGLQWKSKKAENEDELSSESLVRILEKDLQLLKESDFQALSNHFRSKIKCARRNAEDPNSNLSFHQAMKNLLDYRSWFDFTIMYEIGNEKRKELTNNRFYVFSGGEKAMAMYVPLFSAVAAKFAYASEDAPLIIALDEAFAGVDSKNIDSMFGLIKKFGFDYIMNSQVLWGDYPNVDALAIYELYRQNDAKYVTTIRYEWDGHVKRLVDA